ncbi:MAG: hypothetical protein CML81_08425 [Rhodobiaceae bacterium]|jgi:hypothetical protein|nr:hypothetical protein [Rhodobiaceae bacterium]RPF95375.1 MAG: hypothetical protein CBD87_008370 [Rhizobiales bacterium TMED227]|tara:strand:- start:2623 stop:2910 length:288 start_codon:yes stop_codon:yes gene_type:complete
MSVKTDAKEKLFTLTSQSGESRDVFDEDLDDSTRPLATELSAALEIKNARANKHNEAILEVRTNQILDAYISNQANKLEQALPKKTVVKSSKDEK